MRDLRIDQQSSKTKIYKAHIVNNKVEQDACRSTYVQPATGCNPGSFHVNFKICFLYFLFEVAGARGLMASTVNSVLNAVVLLWPDLVLCVQGDVAPSGLGMSNWYYDLYLTVVIRIYRIVLTVSFFFLCLSVAY